MNKKVTSILSFSEEVLSMPVSEQALKYAKARNQKRRSRARQVVSFNFSIKPRWITMCRELEASENGKTKKQLINEINLSEHSTKGQISKKSKGKLMTAIDWVVYSSQNKSVYSCKTRSSFKFKINFITLTIPPQETDQVSEKTLKQLINTWLTYHRKYSKLNNYVWKVEYHKDGRLHVHLVADTFIHYQTIRNSWNTILQRNGLLEFHQKKFKNYNPNSTDVHSVKKVKKLSAYISKYMSKQNEAKAEYTGRVWSCSEKITIALNTRVCVSPNEIGRETKKLFSKNIEYKEIRSKPDLFGQSYHLADLFFLKIKDWIYLQGTQIYNEFKETIEFLRPPLNKLQLNLSI